MDKEKILGVIKTVVNEISDIDPDEVTPECSFIMDLGLSSFETLSIVSELEQQYNFKFSTKALRSMSTVDEVADYILKNC